LPESFVQPLPTETLKTLADFIEYSDNVDVGILESTVAWIQIHDSRLRAIVEANRPGAGPVVRSDIEARIVDAASIYAGVGAFYDYARRRQSHLPHILSWDAVTAALRNMRFWDDEHPRIHAIVTRRERRDAGPFERLNVEAN
jgi:hypothetical protein